MVVITEIDEYTKGRPRSVPFLSITCTLDIKYFCVKA